MVMAVGSLLWRMYQSGSFQSSSRTGHPARANSAAAENAAGPGERGNKKAGTEYLLDISATRLSP
jgi:hypothetical protein